MEEREIKCSKEEIRERIQDIQQNRVDSPNLLINGEFKGYRFALDNYDSQKVVFDEYLRALNKMDSWYSLHRSPIRFVPFLGSKIQTRAYFWEGYQMSLSRVLGVYRHTVTTGNEKINKIIRQDNEEVIREVRK